MKRQSILAYVKEVYTYLQSEDTKILRKIGDNWIEIDKRAGSKLQLLDFILYACTK